MVPDVLFVNDGLISEAFTQADGLVHLLHFRQRSLCFDIFYFCASAEKYSLNI